MPNFKPIFDEIKRKTQIVNSFNKDINNSSLDKRSLIISYMMLFDITLNVSTPQQVLEKCNNEINK